MTDLIENRGRELVTVRPGKYLVGLARNAEEEAKHEFLESVADYPTGDGPDWTIHLWELRQIGVGVDVGGMRPGAELF